MYTNEFDESSEFDDFPPPYVVLHFDYFNYVQSSKPIVQGDLLCCLYSNEEMGIGKMLMVGVCYQEEDRNHISVISMGNVFTGIKRVKCRRLTFTIPTDTTVPEISN